MEEFFQYIGPDGGAASSSALLNRERMFVYSSPHRSLRELRVGSYFACSGVLFYEDQAWLKIRRGYFSNAKNNGYIRVHFEFPTGSTPIDGSDLPARQLSSVVAAQPAQFRYMRRLPGEKKSEEENPAAEAGENQEEEHETAGPDAPHETVLKPVHRELAKIDNPLKAEKDTSRSPSRVVFSGRASKLFGSHLLRPSTIDLPSTFKKPGTLSSGINVPDPVARAAGENDHAQSLKDEISAWQLQTGNRVTQLYSQIGSLASYTLSCVRRPFASCLAHQEAKRRYQQLDQEEEGMEEYALDDDDVRV
ncbi:hypothetical protein AM588_10006818 [Phytophthora nicotianae]|uniref:Uncharacterized protein n=1 Tax=Phytophthora nicotianae TaxID=4792 RepID=A0A0W8D3D2_PHYNI|nr:hypothetical protein AM588_10006818 [Phytophthora nicotianae]